MESCRCTSAHHVASSPRATVTTNSGPQEAETDLAASKFKGNRALERLHRRTGAAGRRSHHSLRGGGDLGRQAEVAGSDRSDRVRRGVRGAAPAHEGARRARGGFGRALAVPAPPPARAGHRSPVWYAGRGGGGPAGAKPRKRAEQFSGRVIGAPWRSRELAATATGAATALRRATQVTTRPRREGVAGVVGVGGGVIPPGAGDPQGPRDRPPPSARGATTGGSRPERVGRSGARGESGARCWGLGRT